MPDSQKPKKRQGQRKPRPEERPEEAADPGHARAREVSEARNAAKSRGSAALGIPSAPDDRPETDAERLRRRARFLRERSEARELRDRVQPRRTRTARLRQAMRMRTFRW
jgi:hypothetical protein